SEYRRLCGVDAPAFHVRTSALSSSNRQNFASSALIWSSSQSSCISPSHTRTILSAPSEMTCIRSIWYALDESATSLMTGLSCACHSFLIDQGLLLVSYTQIRPVLYAAQRFFPTAASELTLCVLTLKMPVQVSVCREYTLTLPSECPRNTLSESAFMTVPDVTSPADSCDSGRMST